MVFLAGGAAALRPLFSKGFLPRRRSPGSFGVEPELGRSLLTQVLVRRAPN